MNLGRAFNAGREIAKTSAEKSRLERDDASLISNLMGTSETMRNMAIDKLQSLSAEDRQRVMDKMRKMVQERLDQALIDEMLSKDTSKSSVAVEKLKAMPEEDRKRVVGKLQQMSKAQKR